MSLDPLTVCLDVRQELLYEPVVLYTNSAVVDNPLALTVPFSVAELDVTFVAEPVLTVGAFDGVAVGVGVGVL